MLGSVAFAPTIILPQSATRLVLATLRDCIDARFVSSGVPLYSTGSVLFGGFLRRRFPFGFNAVKNMHDGVAQGADGYAGVVGQAEVHAAATAFDENRQIGRSLRFGKGSQTFRFNIVQRDVLEFVGGDK